MSKRSTRVVGEDADRVHHRDILSASATYTGSENSGWFRGEDQPGKKLAVTRDSSGLRQAIEHLTVPAHLFMAITEAITVTVAHLATVSSPAPHFIYSKTHRAYS